MVRRLLFLVTGLALAGTLGACGNTAAEQRIVDLATNKDWLVVGPDGFTSGVQFDSDSETTGAIFISVKTKGAQSTNKGDDNAWARFELLPDGSLILGCPKVHGGPIVDFQAEPDVLHKFLQTRVCP